LRVGADPTDAVPKRRPRRVGECGANAGAVLNAQLSLLPLLLFDRHLVEESAKYPQNLV
jgi:hypothetical protein